MILAVCANPSVDSFWSLPVIRQSSTNRSSAESYYPGGKGIHVAFALRELGEEVTVLGIWGGPTGKWLKKQCRNKGITAIGPLIDEWNRLCITTKSNTGWDKTELLGAGPEVDKTTQTEFYEAYNNFVEQHEPEAVMMSGSVPSGFDRNTYHQLVAQAQTAEIPAFVDASGPLLKQAIETNPYAVHINHHEGRELCDYDDPADIARWLSSFCQVAAVTAGADGLYLSVDKHLFKSYNRLDPSKIISTVGAGDCLFAGLCQAALKNENFAYWAKYAAACGSANCINPQLGMIKKEEVEELIKTATLKKLKPQ